MKKISRIFFATTKRRYSKESSNRDMWIEGEHQAIPYKCEGWKGYNPTDLKKSGALYSLLISTIVPRPIALISSQDSGGILNCAPFSYFACISHDPPLIVVGICSDGNGKKKDSLNNIEQTGQFVVNIMSSWYLESANHCSGRFASDIDEMQISGLTTISSELIKPPRVGEAAVQLECEVVELKPVYNDSSDYTSTTVTARIVHFHVHDDVLTDKSRGSSNNSDENSVITKPIVDWQKLQPIGRLGGNSYTFINNSLDLPRPSVKQ